MEKNRINKNTMRFFLIILACVNLMGCAAVGVPITFNPEKKLWYAESLIYDLDRPIPAQNLIEEAIEIYEKREDEVGLARAYRAYANFLEYEAVAVGGFEGNHSRLFMGKIIAFKDLSQEAIGYWEKALYLFEKNSLYDEASNAYFNIGRLHFLFLKNRKKACENFEKSLQSHLIFRSNNPDIKISLPQGFESFEEYIESTKKEAGCP